MNAILAGLGDLLATLAFVGLAALVAVAVQALCLRILGTGWATPSHPRRVWRQIFQSDLVPRLADRAAFRLAPGLALATALCVWLAVPSPLRANLSEVGGSTAVPSSISLGFFFAALAAGSYVEFLSAWSTRATLPLLGAWRRLAVDICALGVLALLLLSVGLETKGSFPEVSGREAGPREGIAAFWELLRYPLFLTALLGAAALLVGRRPFDFENGEVGVDPFAEFSGVSRVGLYGARHLRTLALMAAVIALAFGGGRWPFVADANLRASFAAAPLPILVASLAFVTKFALLTACGLLAASWLPRLRPHQAQRFALGVLVPLALLHLVGVLVLSGGRP
jgi:NADH-quinone oxidoreductase subunit H